MILRILISIGSFVSLALAIE